MMISKIMLVAAFATPLVLSSCQGTQELHPIPGSITYGGQPSQRLTKSPIGSQVPHIFTDRWGRRVEETYILQPDRSLKLVERHYIEPPI
jgi:hypothetical protein